MDVHSPEIRSKNMAAIRSEGTKPELYVRRTLHAAGFRFRLHRKDLPGKPDIVLPRYKMVVFVNGCFWHGHDCSEGHLPKTNTGYWQAKITGNIERDSVRHQELRESGWNIIVVHECRYKEETTQLIDLLHHYDLLTSHLLAGGTYE